MGILCNYLFEGLKKNEDKILSEGKKIITYSEFYEEIKSIAELLSKGKKYGVLCSSEIHSAVAIFACISAGAIAVPLSFKYGEQHYRKIIQQASLSYLISDENGTIEIVKINDESIEQEDLSNVALIMYTSGTTGTPKGAKLSEENIYSDLRDIEKYFKLDRSDVTLIIRPIYHCAVLTGELLVSLCAGADIFFYSGPFLPPYIASMVIEKAVTVMGATPTLLLYLCDAFGRIAKPAPLKKIAISGECMTRVVAEKLIEKLPLAEKYNVYGLTEASPRVSFLPPELFEKHYDSVGIPLASVEVMVADEDGNRLPPNTDGELLIKGPNIMSGYYANDHETNQKIGDGWLHSGDIAHIDENGLIYIMSRKDDMIIRAGMNIYPKEIENALLSDEKISEAIVFGVQNEEGRQQIHIRVVAESSVKEDYILKLCKASLPLYAIPDKVEFVNKIEKNGSGKKIRWLKT